jgi:hypothetical protein
MTDLKQALHLHDLWTQGEPGGVRLNLARHCLRCMDFSGANLRGAIFARALLTDANLTGANLRGAIFARASLADADLSGAKLTNAILTESNFAGAFLTYADLSGADLTNAHLGSADFRGADLSGANLTDAELSGADIRDARITGADLTDTKGLPAPVPGLRKRVAEVILSDPSKLDMTDWHACDTIHCIGGWAVTLAPNGRELEERYGIDLAARCLLGLTGREEDRVFYLNNDKALAVLKGWAKEDLSHD